MADEELRKGLKEKGFTDEQIDMILNPQEAMDDPPEDDPPEEKAKVAAKLRTAEELTPEFEDGVKTKGARFIRRILTPRYDPIAKGASNAAETKFRGKMEQALEQKRRQKKLGTLTFEGDWAPMVEVLTAKDWVDPTIRKSPKWKKRWGDLYDARLYGKEKLETMPVATGDERKAKMSANLEIMRTLKLVSVGIMTLADFRRQVDELTKVR